MRKALFLAILCSLALLLAVVDLVATAGAVGLRPHRQDHAEPDAGEEPGEGDAVRQVQGGHGGDATPTRPERRAWRPSPGARGTLRSASGASWDRLIPESEVPKRHRRVASIAWISFGIAGK